MLSGLSSLKPPSSCYLLTAVLGKLQDDRILRLLAEKRGVVKLQIKHTQMGRRPLDQSVIDHAMTQHLRVGWARRAA